MIAVTDYQEFRQVSAYMTSLRQVIGKGCTKPVPLLGCRKGLARSVQENVGWIYNQRRPTAGSQHFAQESC